jgi:hypothetical protein
MKHPTLIPEGPKRKRVEVWFCLKSRNHSFRKEHIRHGKGSTNDGAVSTFSGRDEREFLGGDVGADEIVVAEVAGGRPASPP